MCKFQKKCLNINSNCLGNPFQKVLLSLNTHIISLCVAFRRTQTAVGSPTGITMVGMAMTLTSGQMTERERQGFMQRTTKQLRF